MRIFTGSDLLAAIPVIHLKAHSEGGVESSCDLSQHEVLKFRHGSENGCESY